MLTLQYDASSARPNTFQIVERMGLYHVTAHVQLADGGPTICAQFWAQVNERGMVRRKDPEGVHALRLHRTGEDTWTVEPAVLGHGLPFMALALHSWQPTLDAA